MFRELLETLQAQMKGEALTERQQRIVESCVAYVKRDRAESALREWDGRPPA